MNSSIHSPMGLPHSVQSLSRTKSKVFKLLTAFGTVFFIAMLILFLTALLYTSPIALSVENFNDFVTIDAQEAGFIYSDGRDIQVSYVLCNRSRYTLSFAISGNITAGAERLDLLLFERTLSLSAGEMRELIFDVPTKQLIDSSSHLIVDFSFIIQSIDGKAVLKLRDR